MPSTSPARSRWAWLLFSALLGVLVALIVLWIRDGRDDHLRMIGKKSATLALDDQERCWNAGDLDGFMKHYWRSEDLKFFSGDTVTTGWQATHDRYHKRYKADGKEMGKLKFDLLDVDVVSADAAVVRGKWALTTSDGKNPHGLFTLLFRDIDGNWVIVSDHTSAADK